MEIKKFKASCGHFEAIDESTILSLYKSLVSHFHYICPTCKCTTLIEIKEIRQNVFELEYIKLWK